MNVFLQGSLSSRIDPNCKIAARFCCFSTLEASQRCSRTLHRQATNGEIDGIREQK